MDSGNRNRNELDDSWQGLTGQAEMLVGDAGGDPDRYVNGVVSTLKASLSRRSATARPSWPVMRCTPSDRDSRGRRRARSLSIGGRGPTISRRWPPESST